MSIQTDPDKGYGVQLPHHSTLIIKSTLEGRTVHWSNPHEHTSPKQSSQEPAELPYQEGPPLPPPRAEENPEDSSREIMMVRLMEIDNDDDSMERVNLDDYDSNDFKEYLVDDEMKMTVAEVTANFNSEAHHHPSSVKVTVKLKEEENGHEWETAQDSQLEARRTSPAHF